MTAEQLIERAAEALQSAKRSGRNAVVRWTERDAGGESLAKDKLFEHTVARDVMTPCTVFLRPQESVGEAIELLERTRLEGIAVVETNGKLLGICHKAHCLEVPEDELFTRPLRELITPEVRTFDEGESLSALVEHFNGEGDAIAIVLSAGRPIGYVTCDSLVAMSRPVIADSLCETAAYGDTSDYLLVPDARFQESEQATP